MTTVQAMLAGATLAWAPTILVFIFIVRDMRNTRSLD
jgi:ABC-type glycerol-3-phosphate transport system permease component